MSKFHIVITEESEGDTNTLAAIPIKRLSIRVDTIDLSAVIRTLTTLSKKTRSDAGKKREGRA